MHYDDDDEIAQIKIEQVEHDHIEIQFIPLSLGVLEVEHLDNDINDEIILQIVGFDALGLDDDEVEVELVELDEMLDIFVVNEILQQFLNDEIEVFENNLIMIEH